MKHSLRVADQTYANSGCDLPIFALVNAPACVAITTAGVITVTKNNACESAVGQFKTFTVTRQNKWVALQSQEFKIYQPLTCPLNWTWTALPSEVTISEGNKDEYPTHTFSKVVTATSEVTTGCGDAEVTITSDNDQLA